MSRLGLTVLFVIGVSIPFSGIFAADQEPPKVVCGEAVSEIGWDSFSEGRGKPYLERGDKLGLYAELRQLMIAQSDDWPAEIRSPVAEAISGLIAGERTLSKFTISQDLSSIQKKQYAFLRTPVQIEMPLDGSSSGCQTKKSKQTHIEAARFIMLVRKSGVMIDRPLYTQLADVTKALEDVYDKYLFEGFPMYPWEASANSFLLTDKSIANGPPRNQLVLMHPAAGVLGAAGSGSATDIDAALSIEPIGWIHYSDDYENWYGVSVLAVFPSDRNSGVGIGLNYNSFKLGVTWHDYDNDKYDDPTIFLGIDLYSFVDKKYRKYKKYQEKVKSILMKTSSGF